MTIEREEPGIWRAVCDRCGDEETLDGDLEYDEAEQELVDKGWAARAVETVKFPADYSGDRKHRVEYREHDCPDCA